jgi:hypothetical protein
MPWNPTDLQLREVEPPDQPITNAQMEVTIKVKGTGFSGEDLMFGVFVQQDHHLHSEGLIPCNDFDIKMADCEVWLRICPKLKAAGKYDLILWLEPPDFVLDKHGKKLPNIPVNDVKVFPNAITVEAAP